MSVRRFKVSNRLLITGIDAAAEFDLRNVEVVRATDYDALTARVAELEASIRTDNTATLKAAEARISELEESCRAYLASIAAHEADEAELEKDAARYRWLRDHADRDDEVPHISVEFEEADNEDGEEEYFTSLHHRWLTGERADKAIDAAMTPAADGGSQS